MLGADIARSGRVFEMQKDIIDIYCILWIFIMNSCINHVFGSFPLSISSLKIALVILGETP